MLYYPPNGQSPEVMSEHDFRTSGLPEGSVPIPRESLSRPRRVNTREQQLERNELARQSEAASPRGRRDPEKLRLEEALRLHDEAYEQGTAIREAEAARRRRAEAAQLAGDLELLDAPPTAYDATENALLAGAVP